MRFSAMSTDSTPMMVLSRLPVCPTMSPFGKLTRMKGCSFFRIFSTRTSVISADFIQGRCSKGTTSDGISMYSSVASSNFEERLPLKK